MEMMAALSMVLIRENLIGIISFYRHSQNSVKNLTWKLLLK